MSEPPARDPVIPSRELETLIERTAKKYWRLALLCVSSFFTVSCASQARPISRDPQITFVRIACEQAYQGTDRVTSSTWNQIGDERWNCDVRRGYERLYVRTSRWLRWIPGVPDRRMTVPVWKARWSVDRPFAPDVGAVPGAPR